MSRTPSTDISTPPGLTTRRSLSPASASSSFNPPVVPQRLFQAPTKTTLVQQAPMATVVMQQSRTVMHSHLPYPQAHPQVLKPGSMSIPLTPTGSIARPITPVSRCLSNASTATGASVISYSPQQVVQWQPPASGSAVFSTLGTARTGASGAVSVRTVSVPQTVSAATFAAAALGSPTGAVAAEWPNAPYGGGGAAGMMPFPQLPRSGQWMEEFLQTFWPPMAQFIGNKLKVKFRGRDIYIDRDIDLAVAQLIKKPLPLPITETWIDDFVASLWPTFRAALNNLIKKNLLPGIRKNLPPFLQSIDIDPCSLGEKPPKLTPPIKILQSSLSEGWLDLELNLDYEGDADIELVYRGKSVGIKGLTFKMTLLMSVHGLTPKPPFFHGFAMFMCKPPEIDLKWGGILEFLDMHFVENLIVKIIKDALGNMMLLPNRYPIVIASPAECNVFDMGRPKPKGCLCVTLLEAAGLVGNEYDMTTFVTGELSTDPFVTITVGADTWRSATLWNDCNPKWDEGESSHMFLVDIPGRQNIEIHVYDDGFVQKLRTKANIGSAESDEIARVMNISILELLGRPAWDKLEEEILVEKWINLDSWWPGRGMGPDVEDYAHSHQQDNKQGGFFHKAFDWAKDKLKKRMERRDKEEKEKLLKAEAKVRIRAHWRHLGTGTPLKTGSSKPAASAGSQTLASTARSSAPQPMTVRPGATQALVSTARSVGSQPMTVQTPIATPQRMHSQPLPQRPPVGTVLQVRGPMPPPMATQLVQQPVRMSVGPGQALVPAPTALSLTHQMVAGGRLQVFAPPMQVPRPITTWQQPGVRMWGPPLAMRPAYMLQPRQAAYPQLAYRPQVMAGAMPQVVRPNLGTPLMQPASYAASSCGSVAQGPQNLGSTASAIDEDDWDRWPTYVLRVGIESLEKVACPQEDVQTRFYVTCDATPIVTQSGKEVAVTTEEVTTRSTKKRPAVKRSVAGLAMTLEESEVIARKMGILLANGVPIKTIADVLDIDEKTATKILGVAMTEKSGLRDVIYQQAFCYLVRYPEHVDINLEVYSEVPKKEPTPLGSATLSVSDALNSENLFMETRRLPLDGASAARIDVQCQLWPVMSSGVPVKTLIERATAAERAALQAQGHGAKVAVWVTRARDLRKADLLSWSDPYCIVSLETDGGKAKEQFRTKHIDNEPNPNWDFGPETVEWHGERYLRFEVYDKDLVGRGDKLGEATVTREQCLQGLHTDLDLGEGNGTLRMKVAPFCGTEPLDVPYTIPRAKPKLQVWITSAEGLEGVNLFGGKSDPYVICSLSPEKTFQTSVINDELNPKWNHGPEELTLSTERELKFEVRDKDMIGSSSLGTAALTRDQCLAGFEGSLRLGKGGKGKEGKGTLRVKVLPLRPGPDLPPVNVCVSVLSAKELKRSDLLGFGKSDPYVMVKVKDKVQFQTKVMWNELNPEWNHGPEVVDLMHERDLCFEVYDKDLFRQGDLLGKVRLDRQRCLAGFEGELDLGPGNGSLLVRVAPALPADVEAAAAAKAAAEEDKGLFARMMAVGLKYLAICSELGSSPQASAQEKELGPSQPVPAKAPATGLQDQLQGP